VEFALVVVLLLPLLLAIIELGRAWYTVQVIQTAAREGARVCAMTVGEPDGRIELARDRMAEMLGEAGIEDYSFEFPDPELPGTWGYGRPLMVVVRQRFQSVAGEFIPPLADGIELEGQATFNQEMP
jgi:hypothetical protein